MKGKGMDKAIVITTINPPTEAVKAFARMKEFKMFVTGDNKTPKDWELKNVEYLSIDNQLKKFPRLAKLIAQNHYARKNLSYLDAIKSGANFIYETDDDNLPYSNLFPNFLNEKTIIEEIQAPLCFNIYSLLPRGLFGPEVFP